MIDSYSFGKIVIDGKRFNSDVIVYPEKVDSWWRKEGHKLQIDDLREVIKEKPDVLIMGCGKFSCMKVLEETKKFLESQNIEIIAENTGKACEVYNRLYKTKKVIAVLHLTC